MVMEFISEGVLSAVTGGLTGVIGTVVGKVAGYFQTKQEIKREQQRFAHELALQEMHYADKEEERESEQAIAATNAWQASRTASYQHDASYGQAYMWVVSLLRLVRPAITGMLLAMTVGIYIDASEVAIRADIAQQVVFLTAMSVSWWFGDRAPAPKPR